MSQMPRSRTGQYLLRIVAWVFVAAAPRPSLAQTPPTAPPAAAKPAAAPASGAAKGGASTPAPSATEAAEAKKHFDTGLRLFKEGVYDAALLEFQQSYQLGRRPSALRNVAQCHRELKQFVDAHEAFEKLLVDHASQLKEAEKKDYARALADLALVTAQIDVKANEPGADVLVDGKVRAQTPTAKKLRVAVGTRKVRLQKQGFDPEEKEILVVGQQETTLDFQLKPEVQQGHLAVRERTNQKVKVVVDDKEVGDAPWEGDLPPGVHAVEAKGDKLAAPKQTIEIVNKGKAEIVLDAVATVARVKITTVPATATIAIDGQRLATGTYEGELVDGEHKLEVTAPAHQPVTRQMKVVAGQTMTQDVTLTPTPAPIAPPQEEKPEYTGIYGSLFFTGQFETSGSADAWKCGSNHACERMPPVGGGLGLRFGYNIEYVGIEFVGLMTATYGHQKLAATGAPAQAGQRITPDSIAAREEELHLVGYTPFLGLGVRASNQGTVRFTAGIAPGVSFRNTALVRRVQGGVQVLDIPTANVSQVGFGFAWDAGVMLGSTPGTKIFLGIQGLVDTNDNMTAGGSGASNAVVPSTGAAVTVTDGPFPLTRSMNVYLGPTVGFQWGH